MEKTIKMEDIINSLVTPDNITLETRMFFPNQNDNSTNYEQTTNELKNQYIKQEMNIYEKDFSIHVIYEIEMLMYTFEKLKQIKEGKLKLPDNRDNYIIIESFLIHLRNLTDFFYPNEKNINDINYMYLFVSDRLHLMINENSLKAINEYKNAIHRLVAHISKSREDMVFLKNALNNEIELAKIVFKLIYHFLNEPIWEQNQKRQRFIELRKEYNEFFIKNKFTH